jgi:ComF family protein
MPVPLSCERFRQRGYNQALEIARRIEGHLQIPLCTDALVRTRDTAEQAGLNRKERRKNLRNAFAVEGHALPRHVAVIDDVVTTGSTANEIARILRKAGVRRVQVWAIARAGRL